MLLTPIRVGVCAQAGYAACGRNAGCVAPKTSIPTFMAGVFRNARSASPNDKRLESASLSAVSQAADFVPSEAGSRDGTIDSAHGLRAHHPCSNKDSRGMRRIKQLWQLKRY